jgi:hypothetical protein
LGIDELAIVHGFLLITTVLILVRGADRDPGHRRQHAGRAGDGRRSVERKRRAATAIALGLADLV